MLFEWNPVKAMANLSKHGVAFEDAMMVFDDPLQRSRQDRHEGGEVRWQTAGSVAGLLLVVAHTWREGDGDRDEMVRIISARRVTKGERRDYEQG